MQTTLSLPLILLGLMLVSATQGCSNHQNEQTHRPSLTSETQGTPRDVNCESLNAWVQESQQIDIVGVGAHVQNTPLSVAFRDDTFQKFFGVRYGELSKREKRSFEKAIKRCDSLGVNQSEIAIPFQRNERPHYYQAWQRAILKANSAETTAQINHNNRFNEYTRLDREMRKKPWQVNYKGDILFEGGSYTVYRYSQPKLGASPAGLTESCGHRQALFSIVHEQDFDHSFTESYISQIIHNHNLFKNGEQHCGEIDGIRLMFYMENTLFWVDGGLSKNKSLTGLSDFDMKINNAAFMWASVYLNSERTDFSISRKFLASEALSFHLDEYEDEIATVNATLSFIQRGKRTRKQQREIDERQALADAANANCRKSISTVLNTYYAELADKKRPSTVRHLHCGLFEHQYQFQSGHFRDMVASALISASTDTCAAHTPTGATKITATTPRQMCTEDQWGNQSNCYDLAPRVETIYIDNALMPIYGRREASAAETFAGLLTEASQALSRGSLLSERIHLMRDFKGLLKRAGCASEAHKRLNNNLIKLFATY